MRKSPIKQPEELPRYVIDDASSDSKTKLLPVEQKKALEKLMRAGGHVLDSSERELIDKLLVRLADEGHRMQALQNVTGSSKPLDSALRQASVVGKQTGGIHRSAKDAMGHDNALASIKSGKTSSSIPSKPAQTAEATPPENEEPQETPEPENRDIQYLGYKPEEVVKRYIESWNRQMFRAEFDCFSRSFLPMEKDEYVSRRQEMYRQSLGSGGQDQRFGELIEVNSTGYESEVICTKRLKIGNGPDKEERELYRLRIEDGHWVIYYVKPLD